MAGGGTTLEYTPTWVVAVVCTVIVAISLAVERILHYAGKWLKKKNQKPLFQALQKIKEELMLLGFISLLLAVFQDRIAKICMPKHFADHWLPCKKVDDYGAKAKTTAHFQTFFSSVINGPTRRLLADSSDATSYCEKKGKVPLLSITALHHLHIFIFVLAVVHVTFCVLTIILGGIKIRMWKKWEDVFQSKDSTPEEDMKKEFVNVQQHEFIKGRFLGLGGFASFMGWIHSFIKQLFASVTKSDYSTLRLGFIMTHCRGNPKFNFHKYMIRALEADFRKVVGISWYLWVFVIVFLLVNAYGWNAYFWISFVPLILLLAVGTKLEHVITQLAHEVASKHAAIEGELVVKPSDEHFWFKKPQLILLLIHIILFQNSFEIAVFFWILLQYGFHSCIMGKVGFVIPRLVIGVFVQFLCSFSTLPLYAIVTQMGSSFNKAIFEKDVQEGLAGWAQKAKMKGGFRKAANGSNQVGPRGNSTPQADIQLANAADQRMEEGEAGEISADNGQKSSVFKQ
uniref:MLO-like protein n=1 Tax=Kalanchoe fedtschenkoi TaxID=63787 RepID=A0A7N0U7G2_KALFE